MHLDLSPILLGGMKILLMLCALYMISSQFLDPSPYKTMMPCIRSEEYFNFSFFLHILGLGWDNGHFLPD